MSSKKATIEIPNNLYELLKKRVEESEEYETVNDFVLYLLNQFLNLNEFDNKTEEEEEEIKRRLKKLGYL